MDASRHGRALEQDARVARVEFACYAPLGFGEEVVVCGDAASGAAAARTAKAMAQTTTKMRTKTQLLPSRGVADLGLLGEGGVVPRGVAAGASRPRLITDLGFS